MKKYAVYEIKFKMYLVTSSSEELSSSSSSDEILRFLDPPPPPDDFLEGDDEVFLLLLLLDLLLTWAINLGGLDSVLGRLRLDLRMPYISGSFSQTFFASEFSSSSLFIFQKRYACI